MYRMKEYGEIAEVRMRLVLRCLPGEGFKYLCKIMSEIKKIIVVAK